MFYPLEVFVGLRYLRARRRNHFVSFISMASLLGIALGVAALIVVLSVMNGFEGELRQRLLSMTAHATVSAKRGGLENWQDLLVQARAAPEVVAAAPFVELEGMLSRGKELAPTRIRGIDPLLEPGVSTIDRHLAQGNLDSLQPGKRRIILGSALSMMLGVNLGDPVILMVPEGDSRTGSVTPRMARFVVSGVFEVGLQEQDATLALVHLADAAAMAGLGGSVTGIRLEYRDIFRAPVLSSRWVASLGDESLRARDWSLENASYFRAIAIEKTMMSLILMLVVAVAAFNIVSSLVMLVSEKKTDIAILRTVGLSPGSVIKTFMFQGAVLGWAGTLIGVVMGVALSENLNTVVPAIESLFGFEIFPSSVYYITDLPTDLRLADVFWIGGTALVLTLLATIYPARRAAAVEPAEALRYE
jgi:lipoprotein-releasing system permease protein